MWDFVDGTERGLVTRCSDARNEICSSHRHEIHCKSQHSRIECT